MSLAANPYDAHVVGRILEMALPPLPGIVASGTVGRFLLRVSC